MDLAIVFCWLFTLYHSGELLSNQEQVKNQQCELVRVELKRGGHAVYRVKRCIEGEMNDA